MKTGQQLLTQFFTFDFSVDGLQGTYKTGIQIPANAIILIPPGDPQTSKIILYYCTDAIVGGPTLELGTTTAPKLIWSIVAAATATNSWENGNGIATNTPKLMDSTLDIVLTIAAADATAGKINGYVQYFLPA